MDSLKDMALAFFPTPVSKNWMQASPVVAAALFSSPALFSSVIELPAGSMLLLRLLLSTLGILLCVALAFRSVLYSHRKIQRELDEIKSFMSAEQLLDFQNQMAKVTA